MIPALEEPSTWILIYTPHPRFLFFAQFCLYIETEELAASVHYEERKHNSKKKNT